MTLPVRSLPVLQNWDCQGCTDCCREYRVHVTSEEQAMITAQGWKELPEFQKVPLFVKDGGWFSKRYRLNQRADGACIFLDEAGGCRIHAKFGSAAKPLACRVYPFVLVPTHDHWRIGMRYACPSVTKNEGRALENHQPAVREYAALIEAQENLTPATLPNPPAPRGQSMSWPDLLLFIKSLHYLIAESGGSIELRLRRCLALSRVCRESTFDRVTGPRLREFLDIMTEAMRDEVKPNEEIAEPTWVGRMLFRRTLAIYARKDTGRNKGISRYGRVALMHAAYRFANGTGRVPKLHGWIPDVTFEEIETRSTPRTEATDELLTRYFSVKLESLQFCGKTHFDLTIWDGLDALISTYPAMAWLARAFADQEPEEAMIRAMRTVDDNFGYNPLLKGPMQRWGMRILSSQKELDQLVAWYAR